MPSKNIVKMYVENGYYHVYNRGVEKRDIFIDEQDCKIFLYYVKMYLSPVEELRELAKQGLRVQRFIPLNLAQEVDLLSFALMPNHFHLQIKQYSKDGMTKLMRRLLTAYTIYFNKKYNRVGVLFQGRYKAVLVESDLYLLHLSRYNHLNSSKLSHKVNFSAFSSYPYYLGIKKASWIKPDEILNYFTSAQRTSLKEVMSYQSFVEDYVVDAKSLLGDLLLEDE